MDIKISNLFDKFFEFLHKWSVGKVLVTLSLIIIIFNVKEYPTTINYFIAIGIFHEIFDLSHNRVSNPNRPIKKLQAFMLNVFMVVSILFIMSIIFKLLWK